MSSLSPRLALRIGLAARAMPSVTTAQLVKVLIGALKLPLTDQKLKRLDRQRLRFAGGSILAEVSNEDLDAALGYLLDRTPIEIVDEPKASPSQPGNDLHPGSVRVAVASNSGVALDGDFSNCSRFLVFQVSSTEIRRIATRSTERSRLAKDGNVWRADLIGDCRILLVSGIGVRGHTNLVNRGTYVVRHAGHSPIAHALEGVQRVLRESPPPWLAKLTCRPASNPVIPLQLAGALLRSAARPTA